MRTHPRWVGAVVAVTALAIPGALDATPRSSSLRARVTQRLGWIGVRVAGGRPRSRVAVREAGVTVAHTRLDRRGAASIDRVSRWSCSDRDRRLTVADAGAGRTTVTTRTPDCARRLVLAFSPRRPRAGGSMALGIRDRWRVGHLAVRACLVSPAGSLPCSVMRLGPGRSTGHVRAPRPGAWTLEVRAPGLSLSRAVVVRPRRRELRVMAAGDSLMAAVAPAIRGALASYAGVRVRADVLFGAGLSAPWVGDWRRRARRTARGWKPDVVVLFLGGADGFPFGSVRCCGAAYRRLYGARARRVARIYSRDDAAQIYWLTLPAPRDPDQAVLWRAENRARARALRGLGPCTREVDTSALLSPGFEFRRSMVIDGQPTVIREDDGVHLTPAAGRLVAGEVLRALSSDAILQGAA